MVGELQNVGPFMGYKCINSAFNGRVIIGLTLHVPRSILKPPLVAQVDKSTGQQAQTPSTIGRLLTLVFDDKLGALVCAHTKNSLLSSWEEVMEGGYDHLMCNP